MNPIRTENILNQLSAFEPITLQQMDSVKLLDRTDTKYAFSMNVLPDIIRELQKDYFVLDVNGTRSTQYETLYFDTKDFYFYLQHHNQKLNRIKTRYRRYVESNLVFFEVKHKSNKNRTNKDRIKQESIARHISGRDKELFEGLSGLKADQLLPTIWVEYRRITFVSKTLTERLTIDLDLTFSEKNIDEREQSHVFRGLVIAEVKQERVSFTSPFIRLMAKYHIRQLSMSKYCLGAATVFPHLKRNNFKEKLLTVKKIMHGFN